MCMLKSKEFERHMIMCMRRVVLGLNPLNLTGQLAIWSGVWVKIHQIWPNNLLSNLFFGWNPQNLTEKFVFRVWCKPYCSIWSENFFAIQLGQITFFVVRSCSCSCFQELWSFGLSVLNLNHMLNNKIWYSGTIESIIKVN
jgi:hypothetical protein